jgi:GNAT superfamily N-acetyltransferase
MEIQKGEYLISTDFEKLDLVKIHGFLSKEAYWSLNIPFETVKKAAENSLNFGVYYTDKQIGYARVISDFSTIAYLGDVFILPEYRGRGLSQWLMETITHYPELQGLRRWILLTSDAHGLYRKYGWKDIANPVNWMEKHNKDVYKK